jgi:hypothetical protein
MLSLSSPSFTMTWSRVFLIVTAGALAGMLLGGAFGFAAGTMAPGFFRNIIPWTEAEPRGVSTLLGGTAGVLLGGGLATFAITVQALTMWRHSRREAAAPE